MLKITSITENTEDFIGYHSTKSENIKSIYTKGYSFSSAEQWLGMGIYFWGDSKDGTIKGIEDALWWIKKARPFFFKNWAIFKALISGENCLDLLDNGEHILAFERIAHFIFDKFIENGGKESEFKDYMIFKGIDELGEIDSIRIKTRSSQLFSKFRSQLILYEKIQICVKNKERILKNILIRKGSNHG